MLAFYGRMGPFFIYRTVLYGTGYGYTPTLDTENKTFHFEEITLKFFISGCPTEQKQSHPFQQVPGTGIDTGTSQNDTGTSMPPKR